MAGELLTVREASIRLGIQPATLYDWFGRSDYGLLEIRGRNVRIDYLQGGAQGQGRIRVEAAEVERLKNLLRVTPRTAPQRRPIVTPVSLPGITVKLGHPGRLQERPQAATLPSGDVVEDARDRRRLVAAEDLAEKLEHVAGSSTRSVGDRERLPPIEDICREVDYLAGSLERVSDGLELADGPPASTAVVERIRSQIS
jgi:hypothetical protein